MPKCYEIFNRYNSYNKEAENGRGSPKTIRKAPTLNSMFSSSICDIRISAKKKLLKKTFSVYIWTGKIMKRHRDKYLKWIGN